MNAAKTIFRRAGAIVALSGLYAAVSQVGFSLTLPGDAMPVAWPAAGLGIALMLAGGWIQLTAIMLGAFGYALISFPLVAALGVAAGAGAAASFGAWLCRRVMASSSLSWLHDQRENAAYIAAALLAAPFSMALAGGTFWLGGFLPPEWFARSVLVWWAGDVIGVVLFLPGFLVVRSFWIDSRRGDTPRWGALIPRILAHSALLGMVLLAIFSGLVGSATLVLVCLVLLAVNSIWGRDWVKTTVMFMGVGVALAARQSGNAAPIVTDLLGLLVSLQMLLGLLAATALLISSSGSFRLLGWPSLVLIFGWGAATFVYNVLEGQADRRAKSEIDRQVQITAEAIRSRLYSYGDILSGAAATMQLIGTVDRSAWQNYVASVQLHQNFSGGHGLGVVYPVRPGEIESFLRAARTGGIGDLRIYPVPGATPPPRDDAGYAHFITGLIAPETGNEGALGLDLATEAHRQRAAMRARDSGKLHATRSILLVQDVKQRPAILLFAPVYEKNRPLVTQEQRRAAFLCWVYSPLVLEEVLAALPGWRDPGVEFSIYGASDMQAASRIYPSGPRPVASPPLRYDRVTKLTLFQTDFFVGWRLIGSERARADQPRVLGAGLIVLVAALLAGLVLSLQNFNDRARRLVGLRTAELMGSNEELKLSNDLLRSAQAQMIDQNRESRKLALLAARTVNGVVMTDADRVIVWVNAAFTRLTGHSPEEAIGLRPRDLMGGKFPARLDMEKFDEGMRSGEGFVLEMLCHRKSGAELWLSNEVQLVTDDEGRLTGYMYIATDITERKKNEEQIKEALVCAEAASRAKTAFLGNISHELRTPLNVIHGNVCRVAEGQFGALNDRQARALGQARENSVHLLALISDLLDITKAESGRIELRIGAVAVRDLGADAVKMLADAADEKGLGLTQDYRHQTEVIGADPLRLKQVLVNLLSNAVKFTPPGGSVTLRVEETAEPPQLIFRVIDSGIGLKREDQERIFLEFEQWAAPRPQTASGTGLGLPMARRLTESHGGTLSVDRAAGSGCVFSVHLPLRAPPPVAPAVAVAPIALDPAEVLILVVEDYPANLELLVGYLETEGYQVASAVNGFEAIEQALALKPDLILMDVKMPGMDGLEAVRRLRANPITQDIPVISLTAFASDLDAAACYAAGANGHLAKPFDFDHLNRAIQLHARPGARPHPAA